MNAGNVAGKAERAGRRTENSEWFDKAVRFGLVVYGVVYLVLAWLGIQLALGNQQGKATTKGAVAQLAEQPFGTFLIMLVALGMFLLVIWRLFDLFLGHHEDDGADLWKHRASDILKAVLYGAICWSAISVLMGSGGGGSGAKDFSSTILGPARRPALAHADRPRDHRLRRQPDLPGLEREAPEEARHRGQVR